MSKHIGIVACSTPGAALCCRTIYMEEASLLEKHDHPKISMHTFSLKEHMRQFEKGDWEGMIDILLPSVCKFCNMS